MYNLTYQTQPKQVGRDPLTFESFMILTRISLISESSKNPTLISKATSTSFSFQILICLCEMARGVSDVEATEGGEEVCAVKEVDVTVPKTDDPTMPAVTFRMWVLGVISCVLLSFVNQFFWYRSQPLTISAICAMIAVVPVGHLMARVLPRHVFFQGTFLEFSMNPGPFNVKEHVLITIFANSGAGSVYAAHILTAVKLLYKRPLTFLPALILMLTTQVLSFRHFSV